MTILEAVNAAITPIANGRASAIRLEDGRITMMLDVTGLVETDQKALENGLRAHISSIAGVDEIKIMLTAEKIRPRLIAVASGKGGVGKSTLATNLAVAMHLSGRSVGLVDADIYGPSLPTLLGSDGERPEASGTKLNPVMSAPGIPFLSMGQLVKPGQAIAWRGPMAGNALSQLIDANWGDIRELVVDMPPGTGDIQLSMIQKHKPDGAIIISTPQDLALIDAQRAISFFDTAKVPVIGFVENMAGYLCPHCSESSDPFGHGGAEAAAAQLDISFLGRIPLDIAIRQSSDAGQPLAAGTGPIADAFAMIARRVAIWLDNPGNSN
jgi:ATP-binding protein involved in chromosome partitioning